MIRFDQRTPAAAGPCFRCEIRDGIPRVRGHAWSYYLSGHAGSPMLVLSLKTGERIRVARGVRIVVLKAGEGRLKLGFQALEQLHLSVLGDNADAVARALEEARRQLEQVDAEEVVEDLLQDRS